MSIVRYPQMLLQAACLVQNIIYTKYMAKTKKVPVETKEVALPPIIKQELVLEGDPEKQLEFAHKAASTLMKWVAQKPKKVLIRGEQYLEFGDWQILGRFYGATVGIEWTKALVMPSGDSIRGYEARAIVMRGGETISSAEAMCTRAERNWRDRDEFMLKSMAQTRASAKALRQAFGWVAELAGMKSTPAEEMGEQYDQTPVADDAPVVMVGTDEVVDTTNAPTPWSKAKQMGSTEKSPKRIIKDLVDAKVLNMLETKEEYEHYVLEQTGLKLEAGNFEEIIKRLEALK